MRSDGAEAYGLTMEQTPKLGTGVFPTLTVRTYKDPPPRMFHGGEDDLG